MNGAQSHQNSGSDLEVFAKLLCREIQSSICEMHRLYPGHAWKGLGKGKYDERYILFTLTEAKTFTQSFPTKEWALVKGKFPMLT